MNLTHPLQLMVKNLAYKSDPTIVFNQLCTDRPYTLLLESAEITSKKI